MLTDGISRPKSQAGMTQYGHASGRGYRLGSLAATNTRETDHKKDFFDVSVKA